MPNNDEFAETVAPSAASEAELAASAGDEAVDVTRREQADAAEAVDEENLEEQDNS